MCVYAETCVCVCLCWGSFPRAQPCGLCKAHNRSVRLLSPHAYIHTYRQTDNVRTYVCTYIYPCVCVLHCCVCCMDSDVIILVGCILYARSYATLNEHWSTITIPVMTAIVGRHCPGNDIAMGLFMLHLDHN